MIDKVRMKVCEGSFRKIDDPMVGSVAKKYVFYVAIDDVAEYIPMATNPRDQNINTSVAKAIKESLESNDGYFHLKNRGIVLSAADVKYDNRTEDVTIFFKDDQVHGDVDGGHTYKIVCEHKGDHLQQYVQFEVMTGVEDIIEGLAEARNTSVQVDEKSLAELANNFEPIKEALDGMPFYSRIAFKQYQLTQDEETGRNLRMIDAREIVAILSMFNIDEYTAERHTFQAYSSKAKMLSRYLENTEDFRRFVVIAPDIFDLCDAVEGEFADAYNQAGGRYGRKKYSGYKDGQVIGKSKFSMVDITYKIPDGLIYPVVAAFRCLVQLNSETDKFEWKKNSEPLNVWDACKGELTNKIMNYASDLGDNPNSVGKNPNVWDLAYMTVQRYCERN